MDEKKIVPMPQSVSVPETKSSATELPSAPGGRSPGSMNSSSPSSQPSTASATFRSTTSQCTLPVSTWARIWARPPL